jgi:ComEC/Rec2-related protein
VLTRRLKRQYIVCSACLAVAAGMFLSRIYPAPGGMYVVVLSIFALVSLRRHNAWALVFVTVAALGIGWWRGGVYVQRLMANDALYDQKVALVGTATEDAVYGRYYQLEFSMTDARIVQPYAATLVGSVTVRGFGAAAVYKGDHVQLTGKLRRSLGNDISSVSFAELTVLERDTSWVNKLRRKFAASLQSVLPEPVAPFVLGLLIGQRSTLPEDVSEQLKHVGLTHIIAVSGYNLTIIVMACRRTLASRSKFQTTAACFGLLALFLLMTGFCPPIVRASIISFLGLWAWYYGRDIKPLVLLLVGGVITILANPLYLWGNVSWYLSFLSFFGVLIIAPLIKRRIFGNREPRAIAGVVLETTAASIMVIPYALYIFGQMSLVSLPANVLVVPLIPLAMLLGLIAGMAGMLVPLIAGWFAWPANLLLTYVLDIVAIFDRIPHAFIEDASISWAQMAGMYAIMGVVLIILRNKTLNASNIPLKATE